MTISAQRKAIIKYLESADKEQIQVIYNLFVESDKRIDTFSLSKEDQDDIDLQLKRYLAGDAKTYSLEEAITKLRGRSTQSN
jgi:hypothetical protein